MNDDIIPVANVVSFIICIVYVFYVDKYICLMKYFISVLTADIITLNFF